jgi:hypothetical protein
LLLVGFLPGQHLAFRDHRLLHRVLLQHLAAHVRCLLRLVLQQIE